MTNGSFEDFPAVSTLESDHLLIISYVFKMTCCIWVFKMGMLHLQNEFYQKVQDSQNWWQKLADRKIEN